MAGQPAYKEPYSLITKQVRNIDDSADKKTMLDILGFTPIPQFSVGLDHRITQWNRACELLTGYSARKMIGTKYQWKPFYPNERPVLADLIVNDFSTIGKIFKNIPNWIGFKNIIEADSGKSALKVLKKEHFDLILSDWNMPGISGLELLNGIRFDNELKNIPFIMVTAEARKDNILEAVKAGVNSYIVKQPTAKTTRKK
jgi:two-component system chemotaxis response regulator CheY